jgi:hypothetical protein
MQEEIIGPGRELDQAVAHTEFISGASSHQATHRFEAMVRVGRCLVIAPKSSIPGHLDQGGSDTLSRFGGSEPCAGRGTLAQDGLLVKALSVGGHDL